MCMFLALALAAGLSACSRPSSGPAPTAEGETETTSVVIAETIPETSPVIEGLSPLTMDGPDYDTLKNLPVPETEAPPEYIRIGESYEIVADLQERLMELGFMDNDEPTEYYGEVTRSAVQIFQRQNGLPTDGVVGPATLEAIMDPEAKYYAASKGEQGSDIERIQGRLYELGYLASEEQVTGNFGDKTEEAVKKLQEINGISQDGKVGRQTMNLLYSSGRAGEAEGFGVYDDYAGRQIRRRHGDRRQAVPVKERSDRGRLSRTVDPYGAKQLRRGSERDFSGRPE